MKVQRTFLCNMVVTIGGLLLLPTRGSAEELSAYNGAQLYQRFCASCHGVAGFGDGPVAGSLKIMVPDITHVARRHGGEFPTDLVRRIIDGRATKIPHGTRDMPVWGTEFRSAGSGDAAGDATADVLVSRLVDYLRSIQRQ